MLSEAHPKLKRLIHTLSAAVGSSRRLLSLSEAPLLPAAASFIRSSIGCRAALCLPLLMVCFTGCMTSEPRATGGTARYTRATFDPSTRAEISRETFALAQQEDPQTPASFSFAPGSSTNAPALISASFGASFFRVPPVNNTGLKYVLVGLGALLILGAGALLTPWTGGPHIRLASISALAGTAIIAIAFTIERFALYYGLGVAGLSAALAWLAWSSYRAGKSELPIVTITKA